MTHESSITPAKLTENVAFPTASNAEANLDSLEVTEFSRHLLASLDAPLMMFFDDSPGARKESLRDALPPKLPAEMEVPEGYEPPVFEEENAAVNLPVAASAERSLDQVFADLAGGFEETNRSVAIWCPWLADSAHDSIL